MENKVKLLFASALIFIISVSFRQADEPALFTIPSNFPKPTYDFSKNPLTKEGIELGKTLFYDAALSKDNSISCGSCHQQSAGFTQHGHALSHGVGDHFTKRNSMPLANLAWGNSFGWDGGVHDLDLFAVSPITNPVEMDESLANVLEKLRYSSNYPQLFEKAFGTDEINTERFLKALSQFMLTMVSANSRYDKYIRYEGVELSPAEIQGMEIFKEKCSSCHSGQLFTDFKLRNNGLKLARNDDTGRFEVTQTDEDKFKFKVPSLRNLTSTAPYMHDGRFTTLEEVLDHYASSVENSPTLDPILNQNGTLGIALTTDEKQKIITFLKTLDDDDFLSDNRFSESSGFSESKPAKKDIFSEVVDLKTVSPQTKATLQQSLTAYLKIKNALVKKNTDLVAKETESFLAVLQKMDKTKLTPSQKDFFDKINEKLAFDGDHIIEGKPFYDHQVDHFGDFSKSFYLMMASFKPNKTTFYYYYCSNSAQNWVSDKANESNSTLLNNKCGSVQMKTIVPKN